MKKLLGLFALTLAVSVVGTASQDALKSLSYDTNVRRQYTDRGEKEDNTPIGNAGFKGKNRTRDRWLQTVSGTIALNDEANWTLDFANTYRQQVNRGSDGNKVSKSEYWNPSLKVSKALNFGNLETKFSVGYTNETNRPKTNGLSGSYKTNSIMNEIRVGSEFNVKALGQNFAVDAGAVYFNLNGNADNATHFVASELEKGKTDGWGLDLALSTNGDIYKGNLGTVGYSLGFGHKFRDASGHYLSTGEKVKNNVYLDYTQSVKYTTPSFGGVYAGLKLQNEWEKHTASKEVKWSNTFDIITDLGYKTAFETSIGSVTVNPYASYSVLNRATTKFKNVAPGSDTRKTNEKNEVRAGVKVGLSVQ